MATKKDGFAKAARVKKIKKADLVRDSDGFDTALGVYFTPEVKEKIIELMHDLQLPLPANTSQYMPGTDGILVFSNKYGVVLRFEERDEKTHLINDSAWVLQPLASFDFGSAVVEICPACRFENDKANYHFVKEELKKENINFWDTGLRNMGRLPICTTEFPEGVPVVVDRRAVKRLSDDIAPVKEGLQDSLYRPLRAAMTRAQNGENLNAEKVAEFWSLCAQFVRDGRLVAGWNDYQDLPDNIWERDPVKNPKGPKGQMAAQLAAAYDELQASSKTAPKNRAGFTP